jgi:hypothetical protein
LISLSFQAAIPKGFLRTLAWPSARAEVADDDRQALPGAPARAIGGAREKAG